MASNYWDSTQRNHWTFTKDELDNIRRKIDQRSNPDLLEFPQIQLRHLYIWFQQRTPLTTTSTVLPSLTSQRSSG